MSFIDCISADGLNNRVKVYSPNVAADAEGQLVEGTPALITSIWASKAAVAGGESRNGLQMESSATHLFETRYRSDLKHDYYLEDTDGNRYDVVRIYDKTGTRSALEIQTKHKPA